MNNINNLHNNYIVTSSLDKDEYEHEYINIITEDEYQQHLFQIQNEVKICTKEKIVDINKDDIYNNMRILINYLSAGKFDNQAIEHIEHIDQSIINDSNQLINFLIDNYSNENANELNSDDKLANITYQKFEQIVLNIKKYIIDQTNIHTSINNSLYSLVKFVIMAVTMDYVNKNIINIQQELPNMEEDKQQMILNATNRTLDILHAVYNNFIQSK
jgi:hypothetical protein